MDLKTIKGLRALASNIKATLDEISQDPDDINQLCKEALKIIPLLATLSYAKGSSLLLRREGELKAINETEMEYFKRLSGTNQQKIIEGHDEAKEAVAVNEVLKSLEYDLRTTADLLRTVISIKKTELEKGLLTVNNTKNT